MSLFGRVRERIISRLERRYDPTRITHAQALNWFERRRDEYEQLVASVVPYVERDGTLFDIGANIGYFSLLLARRVDFRGSIHLFEPVPHLADLCRETFSEETSYETTVLDFGLSDQDGEVECLISQNGNIGWNTLISDSASPDMQKIRVRVRTFDSTGITARPSFVKIDVEGAEYKVLRGMSRALCGWNPLPVILCEVGWGRSRPDWSEELAAFGALEKLGYRFLDFEQTRIDIGSLDRTTDVLCVPGHLEERPPPDGPGRRGPPVGEEAGKA